MLKSEAESHNGDIDLYVFAFLDLEGRALWDPSINHPKNSLSKGTKESEGKGAARVCLVRSHNRLV